MSSKLFEKSYCTMPKWGMKFYFEHNSYVLRMDGQVVIFKLSHILWGFMTNNDFITKTTSPPFNCTTCQWRNSFTLLPKTFIVVDDLWTLRRLTLDIFFFYNNLVIYPSRPKEPFLSLSYVQQVKVTTLHSKKYI